MPVYFSIFLILLLFGVLGFSANLVVNNIKKIAIHLGIPMFVLGILLGILTSFPEFSIAITASLKGVQSISVGNLFGGIMVVFGLILGMSMVLSRKIKTDGDVMTPLPGFIILILPLLFGLDGVLNFFDGLFICIGYIAFLAHLYIKNHHIHDIHATIIKKKLVVEEIFLSIIGTIGIVISSNLIIHLTTDLLGQFEISQFMVGLILFSLGTNLPELTVVLTSWRKKLTDISFSHMLGSAMINAVILGAMALVSPVSLTIDFSYTMIIYFFILISILLLYFYKSDKTLSRPEGAVLLLIFFIFGYLQASIR